MKSFVKIIGLSMLIITIILVNATLAQVKHDPNKPEGFSDAEWQAIKKYGDKKPEGTSELEWQRHKNYGVTDNEKKAMEKVLEDYYDGKLDNRR